MIQRIYSDLGLSALYIVFDGSTITETVKGSSHIIEHIICKNYDCLLPELTQHDITSNAYTSNNEVVFFFNGLEESIDKFAQVLIDKLLSGVQCTEDEFENEKKTIIQEYKDTFNDQINGNLTNLLRVKFNKCSPIGLLSDIENYTYEQCKIDVDNSFKEPSRIIIVGKDIHLEYNGNLKEPVLFDALNLTIADYDVPIETVVKSDKTSVIGYFKNIPKNNEQNNERLKLNVLLSCLNDGLESPLYQVIREEKGLSYASYLFNMDIANSMPIFFCSSTTNERAEELIEVYNTFFSNIDDHIKEDRFNNIKAKMILSVKKSEILLYSNCNDLITDNREGFDIIDITNLTFQDVLDVKKYLSNWVIETY